LYTPDGGALRSLWEPNSKADLRALALNADGSSQSPIIVGDIVDSHFGIPLPVQIYQELIDYLNSLVADDAISEWKSYPYDWRQDVFDVVDDGSLKVGGVREYLIPQIEELAGNSRTGKVTIVTHSNGGLLAKALMIRLEELGKENLVDRLILVATPQIGTPQALVGLLHGRDFLPPYLSLDGTVRAVASTFPGAYGLLPSSAFYTELGTSTAEFDIGSVTDTYSNQYQRYIDAIAEQFSFLINIPQTRINPGADDLVTPLALSNTILTSARATHEALDAWVVPNGVSIYEVAGWGNLTTHRVDYSTINKFMCPTGIFSCGYYESLDFVPLKLEDGDGTVITGSAHRTAEGKYFDLATLSGDQYNNENRDHEDILGSSWLHAYIGELLGLQASHDPTLLTSSRPDDATENIVVSVHSPLLLEIEDSNGEKSGIFSISSSDLHFKSEAIPGSSVYMGGEGKYITVPESGAYSVIARGIGSGLFDLRIKDDNGVTIREFLKLPVQQNTVASLSVSSGVVGNLSLDTDGNGSVDMIVEKQLSRDQASQYCRDTIGKVQTKLVRLLLLAKLEILKNMTGDKSKFSKVAKEFLAYVIQKSGKDIPPERVAAIATCIAALENSKR
jgi:pimeloyl-ACP methyl ester carboxylesterase